jgi:TPR repeat protein
MDDIRECYRILDLEPGASVEEIKRAYRELVKVWHPDRFRSDPKLQAKAGEKLKEINLAYERLSKEAAAEASAQRSRPQPPDSGPEQARADAHASDAPKEHERQATPSGDNQANPPTGAAPFAWLTRLNWAVAGIVTVAFVSIWAKSCSQGSKDSATQSRTPSPSIPFSLPTPKPRTIPVVDTESAEGQFYLGWNYANGIDVPKDEARAFNYYLKAAQQGHAGAQNNLGLYYEHGSGTLKDEAKAFEWFQKAAEQGDPYAAMNLGRMYGDGRAVQIAGGPNDPDSSYRNGYTTAHYEDDPGCFRAYAWLNLAAANNVDGAAKLRDKVGVRLTIKGKLSAQKLSLKLAEEIRLEKQKPPVHRHELKLPPVDASKRDGANSSPADIKNSEPDDSQATSQKSIYGPDGKIDPLKTVRWNMPSKPFKVVSPSVNMKITTNTADLTKAAGDIGNVSAGMVGQFGAYKPKSEVAVIKGLRWLQQNQNPDGSWGDGDRGAMTGLALLCFLGHGETPESKGFGYTVNKAVEWILTNGAANEGRLHMRKAFDQPGVYEHGIVTYALGEYYTMTQDPNVKALFKQAIAYIVQGQGPDGGWMDSYDKSAGDLTVSGWQIQALKAAHLSKLGINGVDEALDKAMAYLDHMKGPEGGYGCRSPGDQYSVTGIGIFCQLLWKGDKRVLKKGMDWALETTEKTRPVKYQGPKADLYAWYYHTRACLMFGGSAWTKWNNWFQNEIVDAQAVGGYWPAPAGTSYQGVFVPGAWDTVISGTKTGEVHRTALCILMLESFYRYLPTLR